LTVLRSLRHALQTSYNRMPTLTIRITDEMMSWVESRVQPFHQKSDVVRSLIASAMNSLDTPATLAERAEASVASTSSSNSITINLEEEFNSNNIKSKAVNSLTKTKKATRKRPEYSAEFDQFWRLYQSAPDRVSSQTKPKAYEEWKAITKEDGAERLLEAARRAIEEQKRKKSADEFVGSLPDLFRWLRDGKYEVYLEEHKPQRAGRWWDEGNRCWVED
jgi:Arc/MetJ-type ribon-helix-helix transcriptional regulator